MLLSAMKKCFHLVNGLFWGWYNFEWMQVSFIVDQHKYLKAYAKWHKSQLWLMALLFNLVNKDQAYYNIKWQCP